MDVKFKFEIFNSVMIPNRQNGIVIANTVDQSNSNLCLVRLDNGVESYWSENVLLERVY